jgi:hypothetical protein
MTLSMYQAAVPPLLRGLNNLIGILEKGSAYAEAKEIEPSVLLNTRLFPDMFPFVRQIQIAADIARRGTARLAEVEVTAVADDETNFAELITRLQDTIAFLKTLTPEQIDGTEDKTIELPVRGETLTLDGQSFVLYFVLPNFYFHITTAYDILRHCGVEIGKRDYLGST